jgi:uncharacterized iron-regulated protein
MHAFNKSWYIVLLLGLSVPCSGWAFDAVANEDWQTHHLIDHPLVGKVWDVAAEQFIPPAALYRRLQRADLVLLGEVHSNPDHHRLQQHVIERLIAHGRRPAVVFEMFERGDQSDIERIRRRHPDAADHIARETGIEDRGWPWPLYKPLVESVLAHDLPLLGADLSQSTIRQIVSTGLEVLGAKQIETLALDEPLWPRLRETMRADIVASHCGHVPKPLVGGMIAAQRARDAMLAHGLIAHAGHDGAVLIAGSGHVRNDLAAPVYLHRRAPDKTVVSMVFTEVAGDKEAPENYVPRIASERRAFDYLWFTPSSQTQHSCNGFKKRLRALDRAKTPK